MIDMARQKGGFDTFVTRESRVIRDWTFEGPKNYTMDVIGVIGVIMWFKTVREIFFDVVIGVIDVIMWFRKKLKKICRCDWRDWCDYVI